MITLVIGLIILYVLAQIWVPLAFAYLLAGAVYCTLYK